MFKYLILLLFICLIACKQPAKVSDPYAGFTERDKIIDAVINDSLVYNVHGPLRKVYVVKAHDTTRYNGSIVYLKHLVEDHYFNRADSVFLLMQNKWPADTSISIALKKKFHIGEKPTPLQLKADTNQMPAYCVLSIPITSKDNSTAFVIAIHFCDHCVYTDDYFLRKSNNRWHIAARKYYQETDGG